MTISTTAARPRPPSNPFATRWVRPGVLAYHFAEDDGAAAIVARLAAAGWRGQILGPHGAGRSTLLAALRPALNAARRDVREIQLHDGQRRLPGGFGPLGETGRDTLLVVDGYEQLGRWERLRLRWFCDRRGCGLLATAHADVGLRTVAEVRPSLEVAQRLVAELLAEYPPESFTMDDVACAFERCEGNIRETLFALYDLFERRRPGSHAAVG